MILHEFKTPNRTLMNTPISQYSFALAESSGQSRQPWSSSLEPEKQILRKSSYSGYSEELPVQRQAKILQGKPRVNARETRKKSIKSKDRSRVTGAGMEPRARSQMDTGAERGQMDANKTALAQLHSKRTRSTWIPGL